MAAFLHWQSATNDRVHTSAHLKITFANSSCLDFANASMFSAMQIRSGMDMLAFRWNFSWIIMSHIVSSMPETMHIRPNGCWNSTWITDICDDDCDCEHGNDDDDDDDCDNENDSNEYQRFHAFKKKIEFNCNPWLKPWHHDHPHYDNPISIKSCIQNDVTRIQHDVKVDQSKHERAGTEQCIRIKQCQFFKWNIEKKRQGRLVLTYKQNKTKQTLSKRVAHKLANIDQHINLQWLITFWRPAPSLFSITEVIKASYAEALSSSDSLLIAAHVLICQIYIIVTKSIHQNQPQSSSNNSPKPSFLLFLFAFASK